MRKLKDIERYLDDTLMRRFGATYTESLSCEMGGKRLYGRHIEVNFPSGLHIPREVVLEVRKLFDENYDEVFRHIAKRSTLILILERN